MRPRPGVTRCSNACWRKGELAAKREANAELAATVCKIRLGTCTVCERPFVQRNPAGRQKLCLREECKAERKRTLNREREQAFYREHGYYRTAAAQLTPAAKERAAERDRVRNQELSQRSRYPDRFAEKDARRRALLNQQSDPVTERVDRDAVFERDGWVCQLCHTPVDRDLVYPDPMSKSLDHKIPLAVGGGHVENNVQLAHLRCNLAKGAQHEAA